MRRARERLDLPVARRMRATTPVPPRRLRARTGAPGIREFAEGGAAAAEELIACLPAPPAAFRTILDFGCGSARVLPHIAARVPGAACSGCDVDAEAIAWAQRRHPALRLVVSRAEPPLPFDDGSFELVYSISVFSHLDEPLADRWLAELCRVLRPGGVALLSVHGTHAFEQFRLGRVRTAWCPSEAFDREPLAPDAFVYVPYARSIWNRADLPGVSESYGLAFHGEQHTAERWSAHLDVERVVPRALTGWQDVVVCRRPAG